MTAYEKWLKHAQRWKNCQECPLCTQRDKIVLARGQVPCDVLFLGEAPGMSEDTSGLPFDGPAGDKLNDIVAAVRRSVELDFVDAYCNVVACFPAEAKMTDNHKPPQESIEACAPRLQEFIELASPILIVAVGQVADERKNKIRTSAAWCSIIHPSRILRMPLAQKEMAMRECAVIVRDAVESALGA